VTLNWASGIIIMRINGSWGKEMVVRFGDLEHLTDKQRFGVGF